MPGCLFPIVNAGKLDDMRFSSAIVDALWALAILIANFAIVFVAVFIYATFIRPGEPNEFYEAAVPGIAGWTAPIGGGVLFFLATYFRARKNSTRNAFTLAITMWAMYVVIDIVVGLLAAPAATFMNLQLVISLGIALLGALAGAQISKSRN